MENIPSLYIHIPYCLSKCNYCDFFSIANKNEPHIPQDYVEALCKELSFRADYFNVKDLKTVYIGGGTPSLLNENQLSKILNTLNNFVSINQLEELTIEVNPDDISEQMLKNFEKNGVTRISVGLQSMNDKVLKFAGRRANRKTNLLALEKLSTIWPNDFSVDLISALPEESLESFEKGLREVISYSPAHISLYSLTIEENTPFGKMYDNCTFEYDWDFADKMWILGRDLLTENGYIQYEVSNFARPKKECVHNLSYWNHFNYIGCGSGGTGTVYPNRWTNSENICEYIKFWLSNERKIFPEIKEEVSLQNEKFEFFMMGLRRLEGISSASYEKYFNEKIPQKIVKEFEKWKEKGLAVICKKNKSTYYSLTKEGILFLNNFLTNIDE